MPKYSVITFGCQMNRSDSERITSVLEKIGYKEASSITGADLIVVNMCSVRQSAVDRVWGLAKKIKSKKSILTGCVLAKDKKKFSEVFDYILNIKDLKNWPQIVTQKAAGVRPLQVQDCEYLKIKPKYRTWPVAFVPVSSGCNNFCTYCVVPYTRGLEVHRPATDILKEAKNLIKQGYKEIWLLGENVNSYESRTVDLPTLLCRVNGLKGNFWIRFTSSHPKDLSNKLIKTMAEGQKISPYLNLPAQSGDNIVLKKMNRSYTVVDYKRIVQKIRKKIPNITLSTDVIVGFPSETKKQFQNTVKLFKEIKFDMAYIAQYSPRPGTRAARLKDNVSKTEKERREKILTEILKKTAKEKNEKFVGKIIEVLPTEYKKGFLIGKSFHYKTVKVPIPPSATPPEFVGQFIKVKITSVDAFGLKGEIVKE